MHVDHIGLSVADLDAQLAWYEEAFGFDIAMRFEVPHLGLRGGFLRGPDAIAIELLERTGSRHADPAASPADALLTQGWAHVCFRVDDLDAAFARLVSAGAAVISAPGPSPEPGVRFTFVTDPEGNFIELLDRAGSAGA
jgi:catechol 2,3-dioxygenase-like lactoylglutathione lyase family enzyme